MATSHASARLAPAGIAATPEVAVAQGTVAVVVGLQLVAFRRARRAANPCLTTSQAPAARGRATCSRATRQSGGLVSAATNALVRRTVVKNEEAATTTASPTVARRQAVANPGRVVQVGSTASVVGLARPASQVVTGAFAGATTANPLP